MENLTIPQQRYARSLQTLSEAVTDLGILDKRQTQGFLNTLLRNNRLDPEVILHTWSNMYGFSDSESFLRTSAMLYRSTLAWPKSRQSIMQRITNKMEGRTTPTNLLSESELLAFASDLNYRNSLELYLQFPVMTQMFIKKMASGISKDDLYVIMEMMWRMQLDLKFYVVKPSGVMDFLTHMLSVAKGNGVEDKLHFRRPGPKMEALMVNTHNPLNSENGRIKAGGVDVPLTVLSMFSVYFTEEIVMEASDRFQNAGIKITFETMMKILDDWDNLKSYPAEWIAQSL